MKQEARNVLIYNNKTHPIDGTSITTEFIFTVHVYGNEHNMKVNQVNVLVGFLAKQYKIKYT